MRKLEKIQQDKNVLILGMETSNSLKGGTTGNHIDLLDWSKGINEGAQDKNDTKTTG